jgi:hypothetical protein
MIRPPEPGDLKEFAKRIVSLFETLEMPYAICGSLAAMEYGEPRLSIDVDFMLLTQPAHLAQFVRTVEQWGFYATP